MKFWYWLGRSPLASALKVGVSIILAMAVADWTTSGVISLARWQSWIIAAAASAVPVIINWLNPTDGRYGKTAKRTASPDGER